jgi:RNA polymerase sigma factor (sigma-70 family)
MVDLFAKWKRVRRPTLMIPATAQRTRSSPTAAEEAFGTVIDERAIHLPTSDVYLSMGRLQTADSGPTDEALLAGLAMGEQAAVVVFVRRYLGRVYGLAYSMTSDPTLAEEVAQESLIRVWRHAPVFDPRRGSVASWVLTITRNLTIDALRMRRAVPTDPDDFAASAVMSLEHNPEDAGRQDDARTTVRTALLKLSPEQRRAVVLAGAYGRTALEISEAEGIPLGTAKTRIRTGLIRLRTALEHSGEIEEDR